MSYIHEIFKRATIQGITDYLLFGKAEKVDDRSYEDRLEESYRRFEKEVEKQGKASGEDLLDLSNDVTSEIASVHTEIGIQIGILLALDMMENISPRDTKIISKGLLSKSGYEEQMNMFCQDKPAHCCEDEGQPKSDNMSTDVSERAIQSAYMRGFNAAMEMKK